MLLKYSAKSQPMIQLIGKKETVAFDNVCVCVCEILASQRMTKTTSFPILMCQAWHGWHHCCTFPCVLNWDPLRSLFPAELRACVCVLAVFSSVSVSLPPPTHRLRSSRKSFPLTTSAAPSQGSIKGQNVAERRRAGAICPLPNCWHLPEHSSRGR